MAMKYHTKHFESTILAFVVFFLEFFCIIHIYMLYPFHVPNFSQFCEKVKHKNFVKSCLRVQIFILEVFIAYSSNIWNFICLMVQKISENSNSIYAKLTFH